jgi:hypothetical protein
MMQTTQASVGNQERLGRRLALGGTSMRGVLFQRIVNGVVIVVTHIVADQSAKMLLVQRDDMVEDLAPATSDPAFRDSILPR